MPKRRVILPLFAITFLGIVAMLISSRQNEPSYEGKSLSHWLLIYAENPYAGSFDRADTAMRHIGTNGIPYYLKWIQYEPPPWKIRVYPIFERTLVIRKPWRVLDRNVIYANVSPRAFQILGSQAEGAMPELARIMNVRGQPIV